MGKVIKNKGIENFVQSIENKDYEAIIGWARTEISAYEELIEILNSKLKK